MKNSLRNVLINSTLAFVTAFLITTFFHEFGHFIAYRLFGIKAILYHNSVNTPDHELGITLIIIAALAGPVFSLLQGILFGILVSVKKKTSSVYLLFLWLGLLGFVNFFGYLMMTPLSTAGDTGKVAELLQIGFVYRLLIAILGFLILLYLIPKTAKGFSNFIPAETSGTGKGKYVYHIMFFPIIIGSIINTLFALPAPVLLSIIYPATSAYVIMISFGVILKTPGAEIAKSHIEDRISRPLFFLFLVCILINRGLTMGFGA